MSKPRFKVKVGQPLSVKEIASELDQDENLLDELEYFLRDYYRRFGLRPFIINFDAELGYCVIANAYVGILSLPSVEIEIESKVPGLEIGKILQLANLYSNKNIIKHFNKVVEKNIDRNEILDNAEYFVVVFLSAVLDLTRNGLITNKSKVSQWTKTPTGKIDFSKSAKNVQLKKELLTEKRFNSKDIGANQTLKSALQKSLEVTSNPKVAALVKTALIEFEAVNTINSDYIYDVPGSIKRKDYETALNLSKIILEGFGTAGSGTDSFFPSFAVNLDELFEEFVANGLIKMNKRKDVDVLIQQKSNHDITPGIGSKKIIPDIKYKGNNKVVVIDTKNKYSQISEDKHVEIANQDIFQMAYYCNTLDSDFALLVYPSDKKVSTKYPIQGAESKNAYDTKRVKAFKNILKQNCYKIFSKQKNRSIYLFVWKIDMTGTISQSEKSIASLCLFLNDLLDYSEYES